MSLRPNIFVFFFVNSILLRPTWMCKFLSKLFVDLEI